MSDLPPMPCCCRLHEGKGCCPTHKPTEQPPPESDIVRILEAIEHNVHMARECIADENEGGLKSRAEVIAVLADSLFESVHDM